MEWIDELFEEVDNDSPISQSKIHSLYSLLDTSIFDIKRKEAIELLIYDEMSQESWNYLYKLLKDNQPDPIASGKNYSQKDIKDHLSKLTGDD